MARGRPRKPTALKLIQGNPGNHPIIEDEPAPTLLEFEEAPEHLSEVAKQKWPEMVALLSRNNVFTEMDVDLLALYCEADATEKMAFAKLEKYKWIVKSPKSGYPVANPFVAIYNNACDRKAKIMSEFGLGPAARTRISISASGGNRKKAAKGGLLDPR